MTKQEFQELAQNIVLLDGATGSNLMAAGMPKGVCTEEWVLAHKEAFSAVEMLSRLLFPWRLQVQMLWA